MKNRKLVCSFILGIFISGCGAQPAAPAAEPAATQGAAAPAPAIDVPTTTMIPLPQTQPQSTLIVAATVPVPVIGGSLLPLASPNDGAVNCRGGPSLRWPVGTTLKPGESAEIVGRNADSTWWYIKNPSVPGSFCWISAEFATVTGDVSNVQVVAVSDVPMINGTPIGRITSVDITLVPDTIEMPGCVGPSPTITIAAKIAVDGPLDFRFHFEGDEISNLRDHRWGFTRADIDDVTDSFTPPLNPGKHHIFMVVDDMDISGTGAIATYTIIC